METLHDIAQRKIVEQILKDTKLLDFKHLGEVATAINREMEKRK